MCMHMEKNDENTPKTMVENETCMYLGRVIQSGLTCTCNHYTSTHTYTRTFTILHFYIDHTCVVARLVPPNVHVHVHVQGGCGGSQSNTTQLPSESMVYVYIYNLLTTPNQPLT